MEEKPLEQNGEQAEVLGKVEEETKKSSTLWVYLLILLIALVFGGFVMYRAGLFKSFLPGSKTAEISPSPTTEVTPTPEKPDVSGYVVQVLNGSGVTGEAARIKTLLVADGFVTVDTGNATATTEATIKSKATVPESVVSIVSDAIKDYLIGSPSALTATDKYDLIIVVGSGKKI